MSPSSTGDQLSVEAAVAAVEGRSGRTQSCCQRTEPVQCTANQSGQTLLPEDRLLPNRVFCQTDFKITGIFICLQVQLVSDWSEVAAAKRQFTANQRTRGLTHSDHK